MIASNFDVLPEFVIVAASPAFDDYSVSCVIGQLPFEAATVRALNFSHSSPYEAIPEITLRDNNLADKGAKTESTGGA